MQKKIKFKILKKQNWRKPQSPLFQFQFLLKPFQKTQSPPFALVSPTVWGLNRLFSSLNLLALPLFLCPLVVFVVLVLAQPPPGVSVDFLLAQPPPSVSVRQSPCLATLFGSIGMFLSNWFCLLCFALKLVYFSLKLVDDIAINQIRVCWCPIADVLCILGLEIVWWFALMYILTLKLVDDIAIHQSDEFSCYASIAVLVVMLIFSYKLEVLHCIDLMLTF